VFWVISVYFNIRNTLPKFGTFLLGHPVYEGRNTILESSFIMQETPKTAVVVIKLPDTLLGCGYITVQN
jgi:hypothetical protein